MNPLCLQSNSEGFASLVTFYEFNSSCLTSNYAKPIYFISILILQGAETKLFGSSSERTNPGHPGFEKRESARVESGKGRGLGGRDSNPALSGSGLHNFPDDHCQAEPDQVFGLDPAAADRNIGTSRSETRQDNGGGEAQLDDDSPPSNPGPARSLDFPKLDLTEERTFEHNRRKGFEGGSFERPVGSREQHLGADDET